ncbi:hypothetical protein NGRA_2691 [Nosema granulosis]|uniref:Uncharacterized protein n=1 Tax=Nosema granulosis TaxID=83296 RepID=A0A9P6GWK9_9MICR|nr:hypothetical protein NGRA_2691 [Nosema granulosis]
MKKHLCGVCGKILVVGNYKARKMHVNGAKHKLMLKTHYMEVLENEKIKEKLKSLKKFSTNITSKNITSTNITSTNITSTNITSTNITSKKFIPPPIRMPKDFKIPQAPKDFKLPPGFDFDNRKNFDSDLQIAISKMHENCKT